MPCPGTKMEAFKEAAVKTCTMFGRPGSGPRGFTLVEVIVTTGILSFALVGLLTALLSALHLRQLNAERALARNAAERVLSGLRGMGTIMDAYTRFGGNGQEETFDVYGLPEAVPGQRTGRVIVWRNKGGTPPDPASLLPLTSAEIAAAQASLGMPFPLPLVGREGPLSSDFLDTNGDGGISAADSPSLMPVTVRVSWRSRNGVITEYFSTVVGLR